MSRVVLTGASGFVGRFTSFALRARGHHVHAISRKPPRDRGGIIWHAADVLDAPSMRSVLRDVRAERLVHLAWITEHGAYWDSPENLRWVDATKELVAQFAEAGGARVVCAGTCAEYDWSDPDLARVDCDEMATPATPRTLYGESKLAISTWLAARERTSWASGRIFFAYGENENSHRLIPSVIRALLRGERPRTGPGGLIRDFIHVADVGVAFASLLDSNARGPVNIASGRGATLGSVVTRIAEMLDRPNGVDVGVLPPRAMDPPRLVASVARLGGEVGFSRSIDIEAGLLRTLDWWRTAPKEAG